MLVLRINYSIKTDAVTIDSVTEYDDETHQRTFYNSLDIHYRYVEQARRFLSLMRLSSEDIVQLNLIDDRSDHCTNTVYNATIDNFVATIGYTLKAVKAE